MTLLPLRISGERRRENARQVAELVALQRQVRRLEHSVAYWRSEAQREADYRAGAVHEYDQLRQICTQLHAVAIAANPAAVRNIYQSSL